jgi:hypothetical protein
MKQTVTVTLEIFRNEFLALRPTNFTHEGLEILFNDFTEYDRTNHEETELDVIAICCEYDELTLEEFKAYYSAIIEADYSAVIERISEMTLDDVYDLLNQYTYVVGRTDTTILFQTF